MLFFSLAPATDAAEQRSGTTLNWQSDRQPGLWDARLHTMLKCPLVVVPVDSSEGGETTIVSGNINAAVLMIGEKGADLVKGKTA